MVQLLDAKIARELPAPGNPTHASERTAHS